MTNTEKYIVTLLLKNHFIRAQKRGKRTVYVVYDDRINPIVKAKHNIISSLQYKVPNDIELWKYNRNNDISLNLNMVRRLHGNHLIKRMYKQRKELVITKMEMKRKSHNKNSNNEKNYALF